MIYLKELVHPKRTAFAHPPGLQVFNPSLCNGKPQLKSNAFERIFKRGNFCKYCFHGLEYLWDPILRRSVKIFWLLVILAATASCIAMYTVITRRLGLQVLKTVVETSQLPLYAIDFPSVAICPRQHVNWLRIKAAEDKFLPAHADEKERKLFHELLVAMDEITFSHLHPLQPLLRNRTLPFVVGNISWYELAEFLAFRCDELLVSCGFDRTAHECCKIFVMERLDKGLCLVFNSMVSEKSRLKTLTDAFYPWKARGSGEGSGLTFTVRFNKSLHIPQSRDSFSVNVIIKEPYEWSENLYHALLHDTNNYISITPKLTETSSSVRGVQPQLRRCLFTDENIKEYRKIAELPYNKMNCQVICQQNFVIESCNCTLTSFFPTNRSHRECKISDMQCIFDHKDIFNYMKAPMQDYYINDYRRGMTCDCLDNCLSTIFLVTTNTNLLSNPNSTFPEIKADIYIGQKSLTKYGARLDYTTMDLLANFGGILGLCFGASILSLIEFAYAIMRTVFILAIRKRKENQRSRRIHNIRN